MALTREAQAVAEEARAKYEASLETLRAFIADFPAVVKRVEEHDERLNVLETRFSELRQEISSVIAETSQVSKRRSIDGAPPIPNKSDSAARLGSKVSFSEDEAVWRYSFQDNDAIIPAHGHWLPPEVRSTRKSFEEARDFTKQLGGRVVILEPDGIEDVATLECVMVEPMGKILSPHEFVSTGLVICIDGAAHEAELLAELGEVLKATKWLDSGISFALPDVSSLAEAGDLEMVVEAVLKQGGFSTCILVGKGWGGQLVCEIAGRSRLSERINGILLIAPESPVPSECCYIEVPVMMMWAEDDEESPFSEIREWFEVLRERRAPTFVKDLASGGHDFPTMLKLKDGEPAAQVLFYTISCLLLGLLMKHIDEGAGKLSEPCTRLCDELPPFIAVQIGGDAEQGVAASIASSDPDRVKRRMERLASRLKEWIREGVQEMASATE